MTAQVQDSLHYLGEQHVLAAFSDGEPFSPLDAGYRPVTASTACWRGYVCGYEVEDGQLRLRELWVNHQPDESPVTRPQQPPDLNGVAAVRDEDSLVGEWHFRDVGLPLAYTGGLVIGREFIRELYVHMGFHPAWKYRHVHELVFERGRLIQAHDASPRMAQLRTQMPDGLKPGPQATREQAAGWIADCFSRDYNRSSPKPGPERRPLPG